jgi:hypothetical protein
MNTVNPALTLDALDIHAACVEYADMLSAQDIDATADPDAVRVPGILVQPIGIGRTTFGDWSITAQLLLVVSDTDAIRAREELSTLIYACLLADVPIPVDQAVASVQLPTEDAPLPCYPITVPIHWTPGV